MSPAAYLHSQRLLLRSERFHTFRAHRVKPVVRSKILIFRHYRPMSFRFDIHHRQRARYRHRRGVGWICPILFIRAGDKRCYKNQARECLEYICHTDCFRNGLLSMLLAFGLTAVFAGRDTHGGREHAAEIIRIGYAYLVAYLIDMQRGEIEQVTGLAHS